MADNDDMQLQRQLFDPSTNNDFCKDYFEQTALWNGRENKFPFLANTVALTFTRHEQYVDISCRL